MNQTTSFMIKGLAGKKTLSGKVRIRGAKNAALKAMAASVLFDGPVVLENVPQTADIETMAAILRGLGAQVEWRLSESGSDSKAVLEIDTTTIISTDIDCELASTMRASVVLTGPLLARFGKVSFPAPGGCVIGSRPIDLFIEGYKKMGAIVELRSGVYHIQAGKPSDGKGNQGGKVLGATEIFYHTQSVGGTETLMMAATLARGTTVLKNCAMEPEIVNVAEWLVSCGAKIKGVGTPTIEIEGLNGKLLKAKKHYVTIPDRIEAGSFLFLGALCAKDLTIEDCEPKHLESVIETLRESGFEIQVGGSKGAKTGKGSSISIKDNSRANSTYKAVNVRTHEYPGFPTDLQAPLVTYLTQVSGESIVVETIFEGRFKYTEDLSKIGADITTMNPREILIKGPTALKQLPDDEELRAHDIRAGFAVVMAALCGKGQFIINNAHLIDRGYERLEDRLMELGADIRRV